MAKTAPIGVRFRQDILDHLKKNVGVDTPQGALTFMERFYVHHYKEVSVLDCLQKEEPSKVVKGIENEFMGVPIPDGLTGLPLAVWKNNIKVKARDAAKLKK